jgi:hypothetical protein
MTGNQDRAVRARARLEQIHDLLDPMLDHAIAALGAKPPAPGDALGVQRHVRGVELIARAARTLATLIDPPGRVRGVEQAEDDMKDDDRDDSPEELDRLRAELESRLDSLRATIEAKRLEGWTVVRSPAPGAGEHAGAA